MNHHRVLIILATLPYAALTSSDLCGEEVPGAELSKILADENSGNGVKHSPMPLVDDAVYLRRIYVDLIGRIPTADEIQKFERMPQETRRADLVDQLLQHERFADTWTVFYADMLRLRSNADGGAAAIAFVHKAVEDGMPYDEMARRFISANGKAGAIPEVGFVLGDNADPMALAGATSQVFMGIRVACAQCHDHPFDKWTQHEFYEFAAYFGKTRRVETRFTNTVYTQEVAQSTVMWPPEGEGDDAERKAIPPRFPFVLSNDDNADYIARLRQVRFTKADAAAETPETSVDDLLASLDSKVEKASRGSKRKRFDIAGDAKKDARALNIGFGREAQSELRSKLADLITDPKNRYFSRCFANRVWANLSGRGMVEPIDDFSENNPASHPRTLNFLADEFVANGYDLKTLIRTIVTSEPYQREHVYNQEEVVQTELEEAFLATPMRRMLSEVVYDSIVTAGHLFDVKHVAGENLRTVWQQTRVNKTPSAEAGGRNGEMRMQSASPAMAMAGREQKPAAETYNLENAIELDFDAVLKKNKNETEVAIDRMAVMSKEELEAMRMQNEERERTNVEYIDRFVKATIDDNPQFASSFRMASPAAPEHFLRVFGQTDRSQLGEHRDHSPSMRQALMMLNGRLTHEASRVGKLEAIHSLLVGENADQTKAVQLAYREILTRQPSKEEVSEAKSIIAEAETPVAGMADLRWLLLNCDEFRFLP